MIRTQLLFVTGILLMLRDSVRRAHADERGDGGGNALTTVLLAVGGVIAAAAVVAAIAAAVSNAVGDLD